MPLLPFFKACELKEERQHRLAVVDDVVEPTVEYVDGAIEEMLKLLPSVLGFLWEGVPLVKDLGVEPHGMVAAFVPIV